MTYKVTHWAQGLKIMLLSFALCTLGGCSASADDVKTSFLWGPFNESLDTGTSSNTNSFTPNSHAAQLREDLLETPVNRYAPSDKDWRYVRGADKGPTIIGARLSMGFGTQGTTQLRLGAVRRGANRTFGPQMIFNFGQ